MVAAFRRATGLPVLLRHDGAAAGLGAHDGAGDQGRAPRGHADQRWGWRLPTRRQRTADDRDCVRDRRSPVGPAPIGASARRRARQFCLPRRGPRDPGWSGHSRRAGCIRRHDQNEILGDAAPRRAHTDGLHAADRNGFGHALARRRSGLHHPRTRGVGSTLPPRQRRSPRWRRLRPSASGRWHNAAARRVKRFSGS